MKKFLILTTLIIIGFVIFYQKEKQTPITHKPLPSSSPNQSISTLEKLNPIMFGVTTYYYTSVLLSDLKDLQLLPNFKLKLSSTELVKKHNCSTLVNGGFYSKDYQPLGWLVSDTKQISKPISSLLFNGYLSIKNHQPSITTFPPENVLLGLQTGPLLIQNREPLPLKIKDDQHRRRLVAAVTSDKQLLFLAITQNDSLFQGPLLADTPQIVRAIAAKLNHTIVHAINLDGGSASTFYNSKLHLQEFSPIGSFFCLP